jgi:hypothetical protein
MLKFSKINPAARAIGTVGVVMGLVGAVTFAAETSNTVALTNDTLSSATAALGIGSGATTCPTTNTTASGFSNVKLAPGVTSAPVDFCLANNGDIPLTITMSVTNPTGGTLDASQVTLDVTCGGDPSLVAPLTYFYSNPTPFTTPLVNGGSRTCTATATLNPSYSGSGGQSVTPFDIDFVGNQ